MDNYLIYQDDNCKIEINGYLHQFLKENIVETFYLEKNALEVVISYAIDRITKEGFELNKPTVIKNIPVLESCKSISLRKPYDIFNEVLQYISLYYSLDEDREEIIKDINDLFKEQNIYCYIFERRIFDVKGVLFFKGKDEDIMLFFGFKDFGF